MTIKQRVARFLLGDEMRRLQETQQIWLDAYRRGPGLLSPADLVQQLGEADSYLLDWVLQQRGWERLTGGQFGVELTENDRLRVVEEARDMTHFDAQSFLAVNAWTNFGFGRSVTVTPQDPSAEPIFDEFWKARRNAPLLGQRKIHKLSNQIVRDGEIFFLGWFSEIGNGQWGTTTLRKLDTDQIAEIKYLEDDPDVPLYYVQNVNEREYAKVYWPDWAASDKQLASVKIPSNCIEASELRNLTGVTVLHAAVNEKAGRGWPQFHQAYRWFRVYRDFLGDRAAVARKAAMYTEKITAKGGSRPIDAIQARLTSSFPSGLGYETNPPPVAASDWIQNEAVDREWMTRDTGAAGAQIDGMTLAGQGSAATGVPLGWMGRSDAWQNRSVAEYVVQYFDEVMNRYQTMWVDVFSDLCEMVLRNSGKEFETYEADVTLESPQVLDLAAVTGLVTATSGAMASMAVDPGVAQRTIDKLLEIALSEMGVSDAADVLHPPEEEEAPEEEEVSAAVKLAAQGLQDGSLSAEDVAGYALSLLALREAEDIA